MIQLALAILLSSPSWALDAKFQMSSVAFQGFELDPNFAWRSVSLQPESKIDQQLRCAVACTFHMLCQTFSVSDMTCYLFDKLPVRKLTDPSFRSTAPMRHTLDSAPTAPLWGEALMFHHDCAGGQFWPRDVQALNKDNATATLFARLDEMEDFRSEDNRFHFKMCYPELSLSKCYRWSQTENPLLATNQEPPNGFVYKEGIYPKVGGFHGLSASTPEDSLLDADLEGPTKWWFSIGAYRGHEGHFFPGPYPKVVRMVELYLEIQPEH